MTACHAAQQKIIEIAAAECHQWNLAQFLANNGAALQRLQAGGVKVMEFPDSVWDAFGAASQEVLDENMGDELFKRIHDSASGVDGSIVGMAGWTCRRVSTPRSVTAYAANRRSAQC